MTSKLSNAALPFKTAYGRGSFGLDEKLDAVIVLAVGRFAGTPVGQLVLGGIASAGKSFLMEGLEEFLGDWLEWQSPRLYGGGVNSLSEQLASSLNSFFTGGFSGLFGAALDPGNYRYGTGRNTGSAALSLPAHNSKTENVYQRFLDEYDSQKMQHNTQDTELLLAFEYLSLDSPDAAVYNDARKQRPSWKQSELDVGRAYPDYLPQQSFLNGSKVSYSTKMSVRPDFFRPGSNSGQKSSSIEVKNYSVSTVSGQMKLIRKLETQYQQRLFHLPQGTHQTAVIDIRGQGLSRFEADQLNFRLRKALIHHMDIIILIEGEKLE